jgi:mRNA degradation ribonuclease J1/J2
MREREMLSQDGIVLLNLVLDQRSGDLKISRLSAAAL